MPRYRRRYAFGGMPRIPRQPRAAVTQRQIMPKKRTRCKSCGGFIEAGETALKLRLAKRHCVPCATCSHSPAGVKKYHLRCVPPDINVAMGHDPSRHVHHAPAAHTVAPPPRPPDPNEAALAALAALQHALVLKAARKGDAFVKQIEDKFKTVLNLQARAVRPGTPEEGEVATSIALQRIIKLVYND